MRVVSRRRSFFRIGELRLQCLPARVGSFLVQLTAQTRDALKKWSKRLARYLDLAKASLNSVHIELEIRNVREGWVLLEL